MGRKRGRTAYTDDFRREAVRLATREPERVAQIARELDVHPETLRSWIRRAVSPTGPIVPPTHVVTLEEENRQLRRENERLREEREILKKATAFFARDTR
ncbi:MAG TPA: transposase [Gemmatimonadaceae bacterium]|jgi:transposase